MPVCFCFHADEVFCVWDLFFSFSYPVDSKEYTRCFRKIRLDEGLLYFFQMIYPGFLSPKISRCSLIIPSDQSWKGIQKRPGQTSGQE